MAANPDTAQPASAAPVAEHAAEATILADGTPITETPNWDPARRVLIVHTDRDAGSNYDDVPVDPEAAGRARRRGRAQAADESRVPCLERLLAEVEEATGGR